MKTIRLTNGKLTKVEDVDYDFLNQFTWRETAQGYAETERKFGKRRRRLLLHRLIMLCPNGVLVDHRDRDKLNNCKTSNLRFASHARNLANAGLSKQNTTGFKGVSPTTTHTFQANIAVDKRQIYLGRYRTKEEAARAYDAAARKYLGEFAWLNFPETAQKK